MGGGQGGKEGGRNDERPVVLHQALCQESGYGAPHWATKCL